MKNSARYTRLAMLLHWLIAAMMIANVMLALIAESLPDDWVRPAIDTHKSIGITVLGLVVVRLLWRVANPPPAMPAAYPKIERQVAHIAHWALYGVMFALPLSGWLHDSAWAQAATHPMYLFGLFEWPRLGFAGGFAQPMQDHLHDLLGLVHVSFGYALYALLALHIIGALKHQFIDRHAEFQRILPID
jgi:cytochrome b561